MDTLSLIYAMIDGSTSAQAMRDVLVATGHCQGRADFAEYLGILLEDDSLEWRMNGSHHLIPSRKVD